MLKDYISLDIENPNTRGNSICSIGIIVVNNGAIVEEKYSLINPEDRFDINNSEITGLSFSDVKDAPTLAEYWNEIKELFENYIVIGHNVTYDLNVLSKSLDRYDIKFNDIRYYCTLRLARKYINTDSYKLDRLCNLLNVEIREHHNALEDAKAAQRIFENIQCNYEIEECEKFNYNFVTNKNLDAKLESNINQLYGIINSINYDEIIDSKEIERLKNWTEENRIYKQYDLFNRIINSLDRIYEDSIIDEYERAELLALVNSIDNSKMYSETTLALQVLNGLLDGIICNQKINQKEVDNLKIWLEKHDYLKDVYPYDKVAFEIEKVLEDGILTEYEEKYLLDVIDDIINPKSSDVAEISFLGKTFCLTGEFMSATKQELSSKIQVLGGIEKTGVSSKLDYLIVGGVGSDAWKFGNIGGKQAKALELNEKGANIKIICEKDLKV